MAGLHLAVGLEGAGWDPSAWRARDARPTELLTARYWADLVTEAERARLDFVTIEDTFAPPQRRTDVVRGRLDAVQIAARVAPLTRGIGLVPVVTVTHTEPFHVSKAIATLDYVSNGRAGLHVRVAPAPEEARHFGRRSTLDELRAEAADYVEVVRRLWDSWEDGAEIRDVATGRFVDRERLHYIDFEGRWFRVKGPSITPRPPQGQPIVSGPVAGADIDFTDLAVSSPDIAGLADRLAEGTAFRLLPARIPRDLYIITRKLVPELVRRGLFRREYEATTLRGLLGLPRPASRYAGQVTP